MGYKENRERRVQIFEDTLNMCEHEEGLANAIKNSRERTILYKNPEEELRIVNLRRFEDKADITVTRNRTFEAAYNLFRQHTDARVGVLNFASAVNPGGGVSNGSSAQEECLCRCSTLYPCLQAPELWKNYYNYHRIRHDSYYTDRCVYIPDVIVLKSDIDWPERMPESERYKVDVITCAAPNLHGNRLAEQAGMQCTLSTEDLHDLFKIRIEGIMRVGVQHQIDVLVLGAFGCGAFHNDPVMVAECFKEVLETYKYAFSKIEFAIFCQSSDDVNYQVFSSTIKDN